MKKPDYVYVTYMNATPEAVWNALTSAEFTKKYWAGKTLESDWKVGSTVKMLATDGSATVEGKILAMDRPKLLSYSWISQLSAEERAEKASTVTFTLEKLDQAVKLTVTHDGFPPNSAVFPKIQQGWPFVLSSLKSLLETGKSVDKDAFMLSCSK